MIKDGQWRWFRADSESTITSSLLLVSFERVNVVYELVDKCWDKLTLEQANGSEHRTTRQKMIVRKMIITVDRVVGKYCSHLYLKLLMVFPHFIDLTYFCTTTFCSSSLIAPRCSTLVSFPVHTSDYFKISTSSRFIVSIQLVQLHSNALTLNCYCHCTVLWEDMQSL